MTTNNFKVKNGLEIPNIDSWNSTASSPSVSPSLDLDFTKGEMDPRMTFNRTTTGTYQSNGTAVLAENNMIRYSEQISAAFWGSSLVTITNNSTAAPDGATTADTITAAAGSTLQPYIEYYDTTYAQSKTMTASVYLKAGTQNYVTLNLSSNAATDWVAATVNLSTGTITKTGNGAIATYLNSSITAMGNGWYRVSVSGTFANTNFAYWVSFASTATPTYGNYGLEAYSGTLTGNTLYVWGHQVEQRSTMSIYTPTNGAEVKNYVIPLKTADAMTPRFEYDPITLECKGLLMEEQRTNLTPYSNNFAGATWGNNRVTILNSWVIAPDGTKTGNYILCNTTGSMIVAYNGATITAGDYVTASVYFKRGSSDWARMSIYDSTSTHSVAQWFNLSTGQLGNQVTSGTTTYFGFINAMIKPAGNGWYRCSLSCSSNTTTNPYWGFNPAVDSNGGVSSTAYTSYGIAWGAQFEAGPASQPGSFPTSYIPTGASAVTRAGDYAGIYEPYFSPWFNKGEGTFYLHAEGDHPYSYSMGWLGLRLNGLDGNSRRVMYAADGVAVGAWLVSYDGYTSPNASISVSPKTSPFKAAVAYNNTTRYLATDQGIASATNNNKFANSNQLLLGVTSAYTMARKFFKRIKYYPKALSTTELGDIVS